ncbi:hypothetical protein DACRYDRAFT_12842 [Dacryopinax primogenitus]|uniref:Uncharacterized protein n=1 Tax=Dacryopinax primogenitus (strain DJM 731) TaxID=1858805 RepID=M5GF87_DACPD|nr:uncharacterized protein DACRYDRAFT_12842 [Dacryopinax primogenitus]EJU06052.1 hypothetical protein DACRYDRAFT_12842 [Dacryopinax primogenitus]
MTSLVGGSVVQAIGAAPQIASPLYADFQGQHSTQTYQASLGLAKIPGIYGYTQDHAYYKQDLAQLSKQAYAAQPAETIQIWFGIDYYEEGKHRSKLYRNFEDKTDLPAKSTWATIKQALTSMMQRKVFERLNGFVIQINDYNLRGRDRTTKARGLTIPALSYTIYA